VLNRQTEVVRFLAYTGLRWGEMAALRLQDFDMLRRRVNVSRWITVYADLFDEDLDDVANLDAAIRSAADRLRTGPSKAVSLANRDTSV
jgi:hypothetical protein